LTKGENTPVSGKLRTVSIAGPSGRLEGLWKEATGPRRGAAVFAHPHPLHGGTLHNKVVYRAAQALTAAGWDTLRFNFRGVGLSEGLHDDGQGEVEDFWAALEEAEAHGGLPIVAGGFSFGAAVAWRAVQQDMRVAAFVGLGLPVATASGEGLPAPGLGFWAPSLFVVGEHDTFGPPEKLREFLAFAESSRMVEIPGADHFFEGKLDDLEAAIRSFAQTPFRILTVDRRS
jgi:alpha/beta superfamily hydrolase